MKETLDKIITDKHLAWNKTLMDEKQQFVVELSSEIIEEIIKRRNELDKLNENDLPLLLLNFPVPRKSTMPFHSFL